MVISSNQMVDINPEVKNQENSISSEETEPADKLLPVSINNC